MGIEVRGRKSENTRHFDDFEFRIADFEFEVFNSMLYALCSMPRFFKRKVRPCRTKAMNLRMRAKKKRSMC